MRIIVVLLLFCKCFISLSQQDRVFQKQLTQEDGLEIQNIKALIIDENGFLWLGGGIDQLRLEPLGKETSVVLQRFNGASFHTIALPDKDPNPIVDIKKRPDGQFYIVTKARLYLFNPISSQFTKIAVPKDSGISNIFEYEDNHYILTQNNLEVIVNTIHPDLYLEEQFRFTTTVNKILIDSKTTFIPFKEMVVLSDDNFPITFTDWEGNVKRTIDSEQFNNEGDRKTDKKWIDEYFQAQEQHYIILYNDPQLYRIHPNTTQLTPVTATQNQFARTHIKAYNDLKKNNAIISDNNGQLIIKSVKNEKEIETLFTSSSFESIGSFDLVSRDIHKELWFTTSGTLNYVKFPTDAIQTFLPEIETRAMASLSENKHLIASEKGAIYLFNSEDRSMTPYALTENGEPYYPNSARNFIADGPHLWSSDSGVGLIKIDTLTQHVYYYRHHPVNCLVRPTDSTIVYGTNKYNLMEFNTRTEVHTPLLNTDSLFIQDIEWRKEDNYIIASTDKGLLSYHLETKEHTFYNSPEQLPDRYLLMGDYHPEYGYLQGSRTGVITSFDPVTETFKTLYKDELKAAIATVLFDDQDNWWINTFNGYVSYNPKTKDIHRFSIKDGFTNNEANRFSALKTKDGFLVGTIDGVNFFKPETLQPQPREEILIPLRIKTYNTQEKAFTTSFDQYAFAKAQTITLPSENRTLEVDFALSQVDITRNERYRYRLNTQDWTPLGSSQSIRFPNLAPGDYKLEVEAIDFSGKKIGESLILPIHSRNFFYKTWWFFVVTTLLIAGILMWMLRQAQLRKQLQENFSQNLMQSQEEERARIAKDLHDSVGQQLTLIKRRLQEKGDTTISELTHKTLEDVRHISRNLYPAILKQLGLSGSIEQLLYDIDEQTQLFVSIDIDDIDALFDEQASLHIYRFIQENVSNVMKHALAKALSLSISHKNKTVQLRIQDNGKGFDVTQKQKNNSLGLKTLEERIRILGGDLSIESEENKGTLVIVQIPIK